VAVVVVEGRTGHADFFCQPPHGEGFDALLVDELQRQRRDNLPGDDWGTRSSHAVAFSEIVGWIVRAAVPPYRSGCSTHGLNVVQTVSTLRNNPHHSNNASFAL